MKYFLPLVALIALAGALYLIQSRDSDPELPTPQGASQSEIAHRDKVAALFAEERFEDILTLLEPRVTGADPDPWDLSAYGIVLKEEGRLEEAEAALVRAEELDPHSPVPAYNLGRIYETDPEVALRHLQRAHALASEDLPTKLAVGSTLVDLDRVEQAMEIFTELYAIGLNYSGSWYMTITYRRQQAAYDLFQDDLAEELRAEYEQLQAQGITVPQTTDILRGNYGRILPPEPLAQEALDANAPVVLAAAESLGFDPALELRGVVPGSLREDWVPDKDSEESFGTLAPTGWIGYGDFGAVGLFAGEQRVITTTPVELALPLDIDNDDDLDLVTVHERAVTLHLKQPIDWEGELVYEAPARITDAVLVDYDHENDLDLVLVGDFGVRLLRNDGAELVDGAFTDATVEAGLEQDQPLDWVLVEDFDTDQDVDLMWGGAVGTELASNLRGGEFEMRSVGIFGLPVGPAPLVGDVDLDGRPDLIFGERGTFRVRPDNQYQKREDGAGGLPLQDVAWPLGDLDGNGDRDGLGTLDGGLVAYGGLVHEVAVELEGGGALPAFDALGGYADVDGDERPDLVVVRDGHAEVHLATRTEGRGLTLFLQGVKDNRRGRGSIVEVRRGEHYQRIYWTEERAWLDFADADVLDVLRVTWPNGVVQSLVDVPAGEPLNFKQKPGLIGSCPFLYSWDGERFVFVSDVLGITPLGLPMAPGMLVPPDHDEYVLVTGEQLGVREEGGRRTWDLQFTEELREVTYLDQARLLVVDHPEGTEVFPDERFCFPPFAGGEPLATRAPHGPLSAREVDLATGEASGRDWAAELAAIDGDYAAPFEHYEGRFQGLAKPHVVELTFDGDAIAQAEELRLFLTGWFFWTNASVNMAAARTPGIDFVPPLFSVPDGEGGWRELGPPYGFPAGKTKTMALDLTGQLDPADPRLRIFSTLRLYWDAIRLGTEGEDTPLVITELAPTTAELWERGFSKPVPMLGDESLEWFDWDQVETEPRWNQHPGRYTRFGDVLPLLDAPEDQYVIMGSGDALHLQFDADAAPPLPEGWRRDFLVYLDGWAKDRDPNSIGVEFVEPMPFHGMSGFPYTEPFPDTPEMRAWRKEWNTREGKVWIEPLAPNH